MSCPASLIPVVHKFGWTSNIPNPTSCKFFDLIKSLNKPRVMDIGAGYGVASLPAMEAGAYVIVNDIEQTQLEHIAELACEKGFSHRFELLLGSLLHLPNMASLDAIHASNVLHFLSGQEVVLAAKWMHENLKTGGKVFLQVQSPWCGQLQDYLPVYEKRKADGLPWPGEIIDAKRYAAAPVRHMMADFTHVFEAEIISKAFEEIGFEIEYADYYTRPGLPEVCKFDGRENLGVIAIKAG